LFIIAFCICPYIIPNAIPPTPTTNAVPALLFINAEILLAAPD